MEMTDRPISNDTRTMSSTGKAPMALERELSVYNANLIDLLPNEGKFVVIHGEDIEGTAFDTYDDAEASAIRSTAWSPF